MPKLIFFITEDWYFCSHRLQLAVEAKLRGFDVAVITRVNKDRETIENSGIRVIPIRLKRRSANIISEMSVFFNLVKIYLNERPDIIHNVAIKPVIYGSLAALVSRVPCVVNALGGMGYLFVSNKKSTHILKKIIVSAFRILLDSDRSKLILQNPDDRTLMIQSGMVKAERVALIRGAGVDTELFGMSTEPQGVVTVILASRMLWNKGVGEFVEAAGIVRKRDIKSRFILVGEPDSENPLSVPFMQLAQWRDSGVVEWWGRRDDMPLVFAQSHIVCLPSYYGEGLPKVLLEAASCGRPIVTTDAPGCREIVRHGENGFLVPGRDSAALAEALLKLIADHGLREQMGARGREIVLNEFSKERVVAETLSVYRELLSQ
jgi:glycosyltransferase involved in cell wall biosynthesis